MKRHFTSAVIAVVLTYSAAARADDSPAAGGPGGWGEQVARLEVGYRGVFVTDPGYNPFSSRDYFSGASLALTRTVLARGSLAFAAGLAWDYGASSASARAASASLGVHRFTVPVEGRWLVAGPRRSWGYAFVRAAPGLAVVRAEVDDPSAASSLAKSAAVFAIDASAGYAFPLLPASARPGRALRLWLQAEVGYSYAADERLRLEADGSGREAVDLGTLRLRGAFLRGALAAAF